MSNYEWRVEEDAGGLGWDLGGSEDWRSLESVGGGITDGDGGFRLLWAYCGGG